MNKWDFVTWIFDRMFTDLLAEVKRIHTNQEKLMADTNASLGQIKDSLIKTNETIAEVAGDVQELKTSNDTLTAKVAELAAQIPDNALVAEIVGLVASQAISLRNIADVVPEAPAAA